MDDDNEIGVRMPQSGTTPPSLTWGGRQTDRVGFLMIEQFSQHQVYRGLSPSTIRRRKDTIEQFARFLHPMMLADAAEHHIEDFLGTKRAARTRHAYRSDLRVFYAWAHKHELVGDNPTVDLESIRVPKSLPRPIDSKIASSALQFGDLSTRRMVALALFAGFRCHEIASLQAEDVWSHVNPPVIVVRNGKGGKDRAISLHPTLAELLRDLASSGPVFPGIAGRPMIRSDSVSRAISKHLKACGIDGTPHQLRHTFGTGLARASGGDMVYTAEMMGHGSMTTTMGYVRLAHTGGADIIGRLYDDDAA